MTTSSSICSASNGFASVDREVFELKILDTDLLAGVLRKNIEAVRKYEELQYDDISITILNAQELLFGALISENTEANFKATKGMLDEIEVIIYDEKCMAESVKIQACLEKTGKHIGLVDEMIAGICLAHNATIVTRNAEHFSRIPRLKVEKW